MQYAPEQYWTNIIQIYGISLTNQIQYVPNGYDNVNFEPIIKQLSNYSSNISLISVKNLIINVYLLKTNLN